MLITVQVVAGSRGAPGLSFRSACSVAPAVGLLLIAIHGPGVKGGPLRHWH